MAELQRLGEGRVLTDTESKSHFLTQKAELIRLRDELEDTTTRKVSITPLLAAAAEGI